MASLMAPIPNPTTTASIMMIVMILSGNPEMAAFLQCTECQKGQNHCSVWKYRVARCENEFTN